MPDGPCRPHGTVSSTTGLPMFDHLSARGVVLLAALAVYTVVTAVLDHRHRRIPNVVTVPMFALGWLYQVAFAGWWGLADGGLGFLLGFGSLLVLWLIGAAGGGDVKLLGGMSVWLGWTLTQYVLVGSIAFVIAGTLLVFAASMIGRGAKNTRSRYLATGKAGRETPRKERRVMPFAIPVACATWAVLLLRWPNLF